VIARSALGGLRVLLAGGGSGGSATPVLAVAQALRQLHPDARFLYVGTRDGPEAALAAAQQLPYAGIASGKLRRYWDLQNLTDPFRVAQGVGQALALARRFKPHVAFAAGGFGAVPPVIAARLTGARVLIHQQDVEPGLANRVLVPFATRITVSLDASLSHFPRGKTTVTGNPVRAEVLAAGAETLAAGTEPSVAGTAPSLAGTEPSAAGDEPFAARAHRALERFNLDPALPLLVVTGGGTGALGLNRLVAAAAPALVNAVQIVHLTGRGRGVPAQTDSSRYQALEFVIDEMPHLLAAATVVLTRAGMGTLTELAALEKPALVVPLPASHQWANARAFARLGALEVADQDALTAETLAQRVLGLVHDAPRRMELGQALGRSMPRDAAARIATQLLGLASN